MVRRNFARILPDLPEKNSKKALHVNSGAIIFKSKHVGAIFAYIFRGLWRFSEIFPGFHRNWPGFYGILPGFSPNQNFWSVAARLLHQWWRVVVTNNLNTCLMAPPFLLEYIWTFYCFHWGKGKYGKESNQWRAEGGGERGDGPGYPSQGGIQRVKLPIFKCCN